MTRPDAPESDRETIRERLRDSQRALVVLGIVGMLVASTLGVGAAPFTDSFEEQSLDGWSGTAGYSNQISSNITSDGSYSVFSEAIDIRKRDKWVCWRYEHNSGQEKPDKVPVAYDNPDGGRVNAYDAINWMDIDTAQHTASNHGSVDGVGFVFHDSGPVVGIDLDDCRIPETGTIHDWARDIINDVDSFTEVSPAGPAFTSSCWLATVSPTVATDRVTSRCTTVGGSSPSLATTSTALKLP